MTAAQRALLKKCRARNATSLQIKMAAILLSVNGLDNALEFVRLATSNNGVAGVQLALPLKLGVADEN